MFGLKEGRVLISPFYDEGSYLRKYPEVAKAGEAKTYASGLDHFMQVGEKDGRSGTAFNEVLYGSEHDDVVEAIAAGTVASGLDHYIKSGQFEETRQTLFTGSRGNDIVTAFGVADNNITGVNFIELIIASNGLEDLFLGSRGVGEVDTLIGSPGRDTFYLGLIRTPSNPDPQSFYVGGGDADYATIENFTSNDGIVLAMIPGGYKYEPVGGNLRISTAGGDLVGIVKGVTSLKVAFEDAKEGFIALTSEASTFAA